MFAAGVVLVSAWLTVVIQGAMDPCVNGGCPGSVKAVAAAAAVAQLVALGLAVRFAYRGGRPMPSRLVALVGSAVSAPVLAVGGLYLAAVLA